MDFVVELVCMYGHHCWVGARGDNTRMGLKSNVQAGPYRGPHGLKLGAMTQGAGVEHEARQLCGLNELTRGNNGESIGLTGLAR